MLRRPFSAMLGLGAGVVLGVWAVRTVETTGRRLRPHRLAAAAGTQTGSLVARLAAAVHAGRVAAAERERELRAIYRVGSRPPPPHRPTGP